MSSENKEGSLTVRRTERGHPGHHHAAGMCHFRRNTLLSCGGTHIIVSTVGEQWCPERERVIGLDAHIESHIYETMSWLTKYRHPYDHVADVSKQVHYPGPEDSILGKESTAIGAEEMHEEHVMYLMRYLAAGLCPSNDGYGYVFDTDEIMKQELASAD